MDAQTQAAILAGVLGALVVVSLAQLLWVAVRRRSLRKQRETALRESPADVAEPMRARDMRAGDIGRILQLGADDMLR